MIAQIELRPAPEKFLLISFEQLAAFLLHRADGLVIRDCSFHQRDDGTRWIGLPARQYTKADGEKGWSRIVDFIDKQS